MIVLALGYQIHFALESRGLFLRFAKPADLVMADAGVLDRLQRRDVSGERRHQDGSAATRSWAPAG